MAYEMKDGDVSIFKNDKKTEDKHPEYKGKLMLNGSLYDIALWVKGEPGKRFFSGKVNIKQTSAAVSAPPPVDDDLPF